MELRENMVEMVGLKNPIGDPPKMWFHFESTKKKTVSVKQRLWTADCQPGVKYNLMIKC